MRRDTSKNTADIVHVTAAYSADHHRIYQKEGWSATHANFRVTIIGLKPDHMPVEATSGPAPKIIGVKRGKSRLRLGTMRVLLQSALRLRGRILHAHEPQSLFVGVLVKVFTGARLVYDAHEDYPRTYAFNHASGSLMRRVLRFVLTSLEWCLCGFVDWVYVVDERIGARFARWRKRVTVIHNFPVLGFSMDAPSWNSRPRNAVYIGLLDHQIALPEMIAASADIVRTYGDFELWLLGSGDERFITHCLYRAKELGIQSNVRYFGNVQHRDVPKWLSQAGIGLVMYGAEDNYKDESLFTVKMMEYMAFHLPMITSGFQGLRQTLTTVGCSLFADPTRPEEIAQQIRRLLENPGLADSMGEAGYQAFRERFNWDRNEAPRLLETYSTLLGKRQDFGSDTSSQT